jgi:hypothetical protein
MSDNFNGGDFINSILTKRGFYFALNDSLNRQFSIKDGFKIVKMKGGGFLLDNGISTLDVHANHSYFEIDSSGTLKSNFMSYEWDSNIEANKDNVFLFIGIEDNILKMKFEKYIEFKGVGYVGDGVLSDNNQIIVSSKYVYKHAW